MISRRLALTALSLCASLAACVDLLAPSGGPMQGHWEGEGGSPVTHYELDLNQSGDHLRGTGRRGAVESPLDGRVWGDSLRVYSVSGAGFIFIGRRVSGSRLEGVVGDGTGAAGPLWLER